jgi:hypothetical protein
MKWQSMKNMPDDKLVLLGVWVQYTQEPNPHPEYYIAEYDLETCTFYDQSGEASLPFDEKEDYDGWMHLPLLETR